MCFKDRICNINGKFQEDMFVQEKLEKISPKPRDRLDGVIYFALCSRD